MKNFTLAISVNNDTDDLVCKLLSNHGYNVDNFYSTFKAVDMCTIVGTGLWSEAENVYLMNLCAGLDKHEVPYVFTVKNGV